jgi:hypothetical protein
MDCSGLVHFAQFSVARNAAGTAAPGNSQLGNSAAYE